MREKSKIKKIIEEIKGKPLNEIVEEFGKILVEKYTIYETYDAVGPKILKSSILKSPYLEEQDIGIIVIGTYTFGYNPAIERLYLYAVNQEASFQKLDDIPISNYQKSFSNTFFKVNKVELYKERVKLEGKVMQERWRTDWATGCPTLNELEDVKAIRKITPGNFKDIEEIYND